MVEEKPCLSHARQLIEPLEVGFDFEKNSFIMLIDTLKIDLKLT
jgi:hypothetical protein